MEESNVYEQDLDKLITEVNQDNGMPVDAYHVVLLEYNTRLLAKIAEKLDQIITVLENK